MEVQDARVSVGLVEGDLDLAVQRHALCHGKDDSAIVGEEVQVLEERRD